MCENGFQRILDGRPPAQSAAKLSTHQAAWAEQRSAEAAEQRSLVLERLQAATSLQEVESCIDALGELRTAEEYQVSTAAWKRALAAGVARVNHHGLGDHSLRRARFAP